MPNSYVLTTLPLTIVINHIEIGIEDSETQENNASEVNLALQEIEET